jgi:hypothetical protein
VTASLITRSQRKRLQTLWGLLCRQASLDMKDRTARLGWVSDSIGRQISSFNELRADEAKTAIDAIQKHLPAEMLYRKRPSRQVAQAYGTAGRRGREDAEVRLVDAPTAALIDRLLRQLGWTRESLDSFLRSKHSPVRSGAIRTLAEANRLIWVLKSLLRRKPSSSGAGGTDFKQAG